MTWLDYNENEIKKNVPNSGGVYAITDRPGKIRIWIYVGQSGDMQARLLQHLNGTSHKSECIDSYGPTRCGYESISSGEQRDRREQELIDKYNPVCNDQK